MAYMQIFKKNEIYIRHTYVQISKRSRQSYTGFTVILHITLYRLQTYTSRYALVHSHENVDTQWASYMEVKRKGAQFVGNIQIHSFTRSHTHRHTTLYISAAQAF